MGESGTECERTKKNGGEHKQKGKETQTQKEMSEKREKKKGKGDKVRERSVCSRFGGRQKNTEVKKKKKTKKRVLKVP